MPFPAAAEFAQRVAGVGLRKLAPGAEGAPRARGVRVDRGRRYRIADELTRKNIPFAFVTGYGAEAIPERFRHVIRWEKPYDFSKLIEDMRLLCAASK